MSTMPKVSHYKWVIEKESLSVCRSIYNHCQLPRKSQYIYYTQNIISIAALNIQLPNNSSEYPACQDVNYRAENRAKITDYIWGEWRATPDNLILSRMILHPSIILFRYAWDCTDASGRSLWETTHSQIQITWLTYSFPCTQQICLIGHSLLPLD